MLERIIPASDWSRTRRRRRRVRLALLVAAPLLLLPQCLKFNYGLRADDPAVQYASRKWGTQNDSHQFHTTLVRAPHADGGAEIEVQHLVWEFGGPLESRITLTHAGPSRHLRIQPGSVRLEHRTADGELLRPVSTRSDLGHCAGRSTVGCTESLRQTYARPYRLRLRERIYLEYEVDGKPHVLDVTFPLEYRYHYSWWDVMLGV